MGNQHLPDKAFYRRNQLKIQLIDSDLVPAGVFRPLPLQRHPAYRKRQTRTLRVQPSASHVSQPRACIVFSSARMGGDANKVQQIRQPG